MTIPAPAATVREDRFAAKVKRTRKGLPGLGARRGGMGVPRFDRGGSRKLLTFPRYTEANTPRQLYFISTKTIFFFLQSDVLFAPSLSSTHTKHLKWGLFVKRETEKKGGRGLDCQSQD